MVATLFEIQKLCYRNATKNWICGPFRSKLTYLCEALMKDGKELNAQRQIPNSLSGDSDFLNQICATKARALVFKELTTRNSHN